MVLYSTRRSCHTIPRGLLRRSHQIQYQIVIRTLQTNLINNLNPITNIQTTSSTSNPTQIIQQYWHSNKLLSRSIIGSTNSLTNTHLHTRLFHSTQTKHRDDENEVKVSKPFILADIGEGITGCEIVKWLVEPGQTVVEFDPIVEVQSDKATVEITSPFEGKIESLLGDQGSIIKVGEPLCMILINQIIPKSTSSTQIKSNATVDQKILETPLIDSSQSQEVVQSSDDLQSSTKIDSTPAVRRLAREHDINIHLIKGTGKDGRVTKEDVLSHLNTNSNSEEIMKRGLKPQNDLIDQQTKTDQKDIKENTKKMMITRKIKLNPIKQAMYRAMTKSLEIPHFGYSDEIDVTELEKIRKQLNNHHYNNEKVKITLLSILIKIMGQTMQEHQIFRCTIDNKPKRKEECQEKGEEERYLIERERSDISIAISTSIGLLTPLIPNVDLTSIIEISKHIKELRKFLDDKIIKDNNENSNNNNGSGKIPRFPEELGGNRNGTLTLSNIGIIGGS